MPEEQLKAFIETVQGDTSLQEKLRAAADSDAVVADAVVADAVVAVVADAVVAFVAVAKDAGFSITTED